jgi:hypothetical protein
MLLVQSSAFSPSHLRSTSIALAMAASFALVTSLLFGAATAQGLGTSAEVHPKVSTWKCTTAGGCTEQKSALVLDSASHWIHQKDDQTKGCGNWGSAADPTACPDVETCAKVCQAVKGCQKSAFIASQDCCNSIFGLLSFIAPKVRHLLTYPTTRTVSWKVSRIIRRMVFGPREET